MNAYKPHEPASRFGRRRTLFTALMVLVIAGGTFAATGGFERIRKWLVTVEINGQVHDFEIDEDGVGTFTLETVDGGQAEVQVQMANSLDEGELTNVEIRMATPQTEDVKKVIMKRKICGHAPDDGSTEAYTLEDLGDAEPLSEWQANDLQHRIYVVPNAEGQGEGFKIFLVTTDADGNTTVDLMGAPPVALPDNMDNVDVEIDDQGILTLRIVTGEGREMVMKLRSCEATDETEVELEDPLSMSTPDGEITVTLEGIAIEDE